jgi:hypothetical protein
LNYIDDNALINQLLAPFEAKAHSSVNFSVAELSDQSDGKIQLPRKKALVFTLIFYLN